MKRPFLRYAILLVAILCVDVAADTEYYQEVMWKPRVMITPEEALNGFWPPSPEPTPVQYTPMGLDVKRLGAVPEAGVHPRVYLTPETADEIRRKMALGDMAPPAFKNMWSRLFRIESANAYFVIRAKSNMRFTDRSLLFGGASRRGGIGGEG